ncbi:uncharacterized protein LOC110835814 isoform X2 [Zootermopsis nevadensis]|nr:uncharacterized protein LOC110835814 isoform X2 [Zootermopsis nevadensis]
MSSPALTPVKDKDKVKTNGVVLSPELIPAKRPKTEDFLTFLCFRGTPVLPPYLDFFNIATVQETLDEEQGSSLGECSRESTRNSRIASASVGSSKLQRSTDRNITDTSACSGVIKKFDRSESDGRRKPPTAVQALRRKYQEQRLAKQRASTLNKLAQKVKGKNMVRTRSSAHNEEVPPSMNTKPSRGNIDKKAVRGVNMVERKIKCATKPSLLTRMHTREKTIMKTRTNRTSVNSIRRDGLRSGGQLPPGSEAGLKSERVLKQPEQPQQTRLKPGVKKKIEKNTSKTFASSLSDFSSDDDQPLAKKIKVKPIEHASSSRHLARKVIRRIVSKRMKPRMITRSQQQQQQATEKEQTEVRLYTRPPRKTKEAAAIYMELLGRKLITPEAEADEDSLSIDSFPELPNARRIERRESEIKARAYKERKEAQQLKENPKTTLPQKSKSTDGAAGKQKQIEVINVKKLSMRNRRLPVQKPEYLKNIDKVKLPVPDILHKKESVTVKENLVSKKQDGTRLGLQMRPRKMSARLQGVDNHSHEEGETDVDSNCDKMKPQSAPRRSLRRGSRETSQEVPQQSSSGTTEQSTCDIIEQVSSSEITPADSVLSKVLTKRSKPVPSLLSTSPLPRILRNFPKSQDDNSCHSEETFSDSDEEPLGKLALKHSAIKKLNKEMVVNKDTSVEEKSEAREERAQVINKKVSMNEGMASVLGSDDTERNNALNEKNAEQVLKVLVTTAHKGNEKILHQPNDDVSKVKVIEFSKVVGTKNKELSQRKKDGNISQDIGTSHRKSEENLATKDRELPHRSEVVNSKSKEKLLKKNEVDNNKKKEILQGKNEVGTFNKCKELPSKKSDFIERNQGISNRKGEEDTENEEIYRKTRECGNARSKEAPLKGSDEVGAVAEEVSFKKAEDELHIKKKEMILTSCEEDHFITKTNETLLKKVEEVDIKRIKILQQTTEDDLNKVKKIVARRKSENSSIMSNEVANRNCEEDLITKSVGIPSKKCEEIILSVKSNIYVNANTEEISSRKSEGNISENKEASQRKNEHGTSKNKQFEDDILTKNKEILSKQRKALSTTNEEIAPGNGEICPKNVEKLQRKDENVNTKITEIPSGKSKVCCTASELSKCLRDDRYLTYNTQPKSECVTAKDELLEGQATKYSILFGRVEPLMKGKIIITTEELTGEVGSSKDEKLEPHNEMNMSNNVKILNSRLVNEIMGNNKVDIAQSSHVLKRNILESKTEPQTVKTELEMVQTEKQTSSSKIVHVSNKVTVLNIEKKLPNVQMPVSASILTLTETNVDSHAMLHTGILTSPKHALDDSSDSEDDIVLKNLSREKVSRKIEEPLSKYPNLVLPVSGVVLKQGSKIKMRSEHALPKPVETEAPMISHLPIVNRLGLTSVKKAATTKGDNENRDKFTHLRIVDLRRVENVSSSQTLGFLAKSNIQEPTFRDKVKAKMNMSNEQIEKWLNESYIEEADSKNSMFDKCIEPIMEDQEILNTVDFMHSTESKECDYRANLLGEVVKSGKGASYLKEIVGEQLYKSDKNSSFLRDEFQQKIVELQEVTPHFNVSFKKMTRDVAPSNAKSSVKSLLMLDEGRDLRSYSNRAGSLVKELGSIDVGVIPNSHQRSKMSTRNQEENEGDISKEETTVRKFQRDISSGSAFQHIENESVLLGPSCSRTDRNQWSNQEKLTHNIQLQGDTHIEEKVNKLNPETKKQEGNTTHHSIKSQPLQDRGGEKKSIFQQRRSFLHKAKERKDMTPSANAFSPENESSVYAFESEPDLPPISTPFRRRARDSRTSSTTTSKSEEDLARLDDEITPPPSAVQMTVQTVQSPTVPTVSSSAMQTVQSQQLTLPVVEQPIQTLPLSTAIVQIIPTLPVTMRPIQVENFVPSQQKQQQQQLLLLQNDAVMTTLKTGCTSSTSIAVQVNLDNEPSFDTSSQNTLTSDSAIPEPLLLRSMECSTQTDVAEEEEDDSEGHLFYIPLQRPGTGVSLAAPTQQLIQGVAVKLGTEGPTGPNQRVIMRAKLVTKPPTFNRTRVGIQDGNTIGIGRPVVTTQRQRPAGMLMMEQKNMYGSVSGATSTVTTGTYPPVGTVQPTARGRRLVIPPNNQTNNNAITDKVPNNTDLNTLKMPETAGKIVDISSGLCTESEIDSAVNKPLAIVPAKPVDKAQQNIVASIKEQKSSLDPNIFSFSSLGDVVAPKLATNKGQGNVGKERRCSTEVYSPSTSYTSKSGSSKRSSQKAKSSYACKPSNTTNFPNLESPAQMVEAPVFHPTEKEFQDPLEYIDRIRPVAEKFGLCRVVPPPNFKPECKVSDDMRFLAYNQYVHKMLHRWGPNVKEMMAIKKYLATQSISFNHPPWIGGMEVDLPRLYKIVQSFGGLKEVIEKKKWHRIADGMKIPKSAQDRVTKLDDIYCKYLLPYDTLSPAERQKLFDEVDKEWTEREKQATLSASPSGSDVPEEECEGDTSDESEECIVKGRNMPLNAFYRIARNTMSMWFRQAEPPASEVEQEFWRHVTLRQSHVCVHSGSIDSSGWGYGFPCSKNSPFARHPWNLKVLTNNSGSILRSIGPIMGVTVPTLHVGMLFTACCWYRDPHGLPWVEYLHTGANKIWYGIPDEYSSVFRSALTKLVPRYCKNKTIWLPSDTAMVPPPMLVKHGVSLCHTVQEPGQFILVFPRAFTSSICTGYLVSESVYFAQPNWLNTAEQVFRDIQNSCEPSMFSLERLLFSISTDGRTNVEVLKQVLPMIVQIRQQELDYRKQLYALGLKTSERLPLPEVNIKRRKARQAREEEADYECEMCRANLFVSLVTNAHEEAVYCLPHAVELLTKKRHDLKYCKLLYTYDQAELNELIQKLQERIEAKSQRKSQGKHSTSSHKP